MIRKQHRRAGAHAILFLFGTAVVASVLLSHNAGAQLRDVSIRKELQVRTPTEELETRREPAFGEKEILKALEERVITTAPVNPNYIIGPQDEIIINLWGKKTQTLNPVVDENGFVEARIDDIDFRFSVNGLTFKELKPKIVRELSRLTADIDPMHPESSPILVDVTLGKIRGITIMVLGEVRAPGQYTVKTTVSSIFNVLAMAKGLTRDASLRDILVRRSGGRVDRVDLYGVDIYTLLESGRIDESLFHLQDGDIVVVPPKTRVVTVSGEVRRPGAYEIQEGEPLSRLIELAGGFSPKADVDRINILRVKDVEDAQFLGIRYPDMPDFTVLDGDQVEVGAKPEARRLNVVEIKGNGVRQPGRYEYRAGMTVADLVKAARGVYEDAMLESAVLVRTADDYSLQFSQVSLIEALKPGAPEPMELRAMDRLIIYSRFLHAGGEKFVAIEGHVKEPGEYLLSEGMTFSDLIFMAGGFADPDFVRATWLERADLTRLDRDTQRKMVIPVPLGRIIDGEREADVRLQSGDSIRIYAFEDMVDTLKVTIGGEVREPGEYALTEGMTLSDLITQAHGLTEQADRAGIEIARSPEQGVGDVTASQIIAVSLLDTVASEVALQGNDRVLVRRKLEAREMGTVTISGQVVYPGEYVLRSRTETLADLVERAGGFLAGAAPQAAVLRRYEPMRADESVDETDDFGAADDWESEDGMWVAFGDDRDKAMAAADAGADAGADGEAEPEPEEEPERQVRRVAIDLPAALDRPGGPYDLKLLDGDELVVPAQNWTVTVEGAVRFPGTVQYVEGRKSSYYINFVGGCTDAAQRGKTLVIYPNGRARRATRLLFFRTPIRPGSTILVPEAAGDGDR